MKYFENEDTIWESKNKRIILTTHRLREMHSNLFGSKIKSIMLEDLTSCELKTIRQMRFLRQAIFYFLIINGGLYLLNNYLFNAELIKWFSNDVHIGSESAKIIFNISILISAVYIALFFLSVKKVFSFNSNGLSINTSIRWLDFEERESFISKVEETKNNRNKKLN